MNSSKNKQEKLTNRDLIYLRHIYKVIEKEKIHSFDLNKLSPAWLLSEKQLQEALFWDRYSENGTLLVGWLIAIILGLFGFPYFFIFFLFISTIPGNFILSLAIPTVFILLSLIAIARLCRFLLALLKGKKVQFDSHNLTRSEHKAIYCALQADKTLPTQPEKWLAKMEKIGALAKGPNGWEFRNTTFTDWLIRSK